MTNAKIILVTGPPASGKTTVTKLLAKSFPKTALIDVDQLRSMIKKGKKVPWGKTAESQKQLRIVTKIACYAAQQFAQNGFRVFIDDVALKEELEEYSGRLKPFGFQAFVLLPGQKTVAQRDRKRSKVLFMGKRTIELYQKFAKKRNNPAWKIIDSTHQTPKQTVQEIKKELKDL